MLNKAIARWVLPEPAAPQLVQGLVSALGLPRIVADLLVRRGYQEPAAAQRFLYPRLNTLSDPFLLPDMEIAVWRILQAIDQKQTIVLYGDYDVDGLTSLTLLHRILALYQADVHCFLPQRKDEGYGLSAKGVARCVDEYAPTLLIAIDCGTSSVAEIQQLKDVGVDVVVLDHHECPEQLPPCVALVNPKKGQVFHYLCSVGIVFKVAHALLKQRPNAAVQLKDYLDLVALGSVADLVPLVEENRVLVQKGLEQLAVTKWQGIKTLAEKAGVKPPWAASDVGFKLGPRLNAAGRLGEAKRAFHLLMSENEVDAASLTEELEEENQNRKVIAEDVYQLAEAQVAEKFNIVKDFAIVVGGDGWHEGVIGIAASKLMHKYNRPAIVIGFDAQGCGKGSCRSIPGFSLVSALRSCGAYLEKSGGHEMAAGLSIRREQFENFRTAFVREAGELIREEELTPLIVPDAEVHIHELNLVLLEQLAKLGPFGIANASPVFLLRNVFPAGQPRVMKEKHLSLEIRQDKETARAIWFNGATDPVPKAPWDVAFELVRNEYQGRVQPQIQIRALRSAAGT